MKHPFLFFFFLTACTDIGTPDPKTAFRRKDLTQTWEMRDFRPQSKPGVDSTVWRILEQKMLIHLFNDGKMAFLHGAEYQYCDWEFDTETSTLALKGNKPKTLYLRPSPNADHGVLVAKWVVKNDTFTTWWQTYGYRPESPEQSAWHPDLNQWRLKPTASENDEALRKRLRNHLQHYRTLLEEKITHGGTRFTTRFSPTPLWLLRSGIALYPPDKIESAWTNCFFNAQEAAKANEMLKNFLGANGVLKPEKPTVFDKDALWAVNTLLEKLQ